MTCCVVRELEVDGLFETGMRDVGVVEEEVGGRRDEEEDGGDNGEEDEA